MPRVSVVVPVYNAEPYLREAIDSILAQSFGDFELILVDDGSTDGSAKVMASYGSRVMSIHQPNAGPSAARNAGIAKASAELVTFCDADDIQKPYRLEAQVHVMDHFPEVALVASELSQYINGEITDEFALRKLWIGPTTRGLDTELEAFFQTYQTCRELKIPVPEAYQSRRLYHGDAAPLITLVHLAWGNASLFRRAALEAVGRFDRSVRSYEDWHLCARIAKIKPIAFLDIPVMLYRRHPDQYTKIRGLAAEGYLRVVNDVWRSDANYYARHRRLVNRAAASAHYQVGTHAASMARWAIAEESFLSSILASPRQGRVYLELLEATLKRRAPKLKRLGRS